jgi:hypothetical protein
MKSERPASAAVFRPVGNSIGAYAEKGLLGTYTTMVGHPGKGGQGGAEGGKGTGKPNPAKDE